MSLAAQTQLAPRGSPAETVQRVLDHPVGAPDRLAKGEQIGARDHDPFWRVLAALRDIAFLAARVLPAFAILAARVLPNRDFSLSYTARLFFAIDLSLPRGMAITPFRRRRCSRRADAHGLAFRSLNARRSVMATLGIATCARYSS